jgi:hypothetical protein
LGDVAQEAANWLCDRCWAVWGVQIWGQLLNHSRDLVRQGACALACRWLINQVWVNCISSSSGQLTYPLGPVYVRSECCGQWVPIRILRCVKLFDLTGRSVLIIIVISFWGGIV